MSTIKRLCLAAVTAVATILPVGAEIQPGTADLLETMDENGITITVNHPDCATSSYNGQYRWRGFQREMILCAGTTVDARDHETVRHETIHAIQHCVNVGRGTNTDTPIINDVNKLMTWARQHISMRRIEWIQNTYDRSQWLTEIEAFAGANAYTSAQLEILFLKACTV